ncbi:hypothetical protein N9Y42_11115, partial [Mariniblastus sp.]|nr:hypothetical protein [Mariniblastus sp.]
SLDSLCKIHKTSLPRRAIWGILTLSWKPKAIEKSASSTSLSAKAVNGYDLPYAQEAGLRKPNVACPLLIPGRIRRKLPDVASGVCRRG